MAQCVKDLRVNIQTPPSAPVQKHPIAITTVKNHNIVQQLADQPADLLEDVLAHVARAGNFLRTAPNPNATTATQEPQIEHPLPHIARFLFLVGHTGIREMVHLDQSIYKELKRRNAVREKKKEARARVSNAARRRKSMNASTMSTMSTVSNVSTVMGSAQRSIRGSKGDEEDQDGMEGATADDADAEHINMCLEDELLAEGGFLSKFV